MKKPELLAPAGSTESLIAAINAGCDAVYLGGYKFGARKYASFNYDELKDAVALAHLFDVKVYVTVNTMIYDEEIDEVQVYINELDQLGVDGVIVQDLGLINMVKQTNMELHASTQMHVHNLEGLKWCGDNGFERAVIARETPVDLIRRMKYSTDVELEVFVHGALCISYSGQCYMSEQIGGRSGNRGECAQACRLSYDMNGKEGYHISPKDLMLLDEIDELMEIGVDSFKIEGRLKRPEYVYEVVSAYRKKIDAFYQDKQIDLTTEKKNIQKVFNRKFTTGYVFDETPDYINEFQPNHIGIPLGEVISTKKRMQVKLSIDLNQGDGLRFLVGDGLGFVANRIYKNDLLVNGAQKGEVIEFDYLKGVKKGTRIVKTTDVLQIKEIQKLIKEVTKKIPLHIKGTFKIGEPVQLVFSSKGQQVSVTSTQVCVEASKQGVTEDRIHKQLSKLGDSIFTLDSYHFDIDDQLFLPMSVLNQLRRDAVDALINEFVDSRSVKEKIQSKINEVNETNEVIVSYQTPDQREVIELFGYTAVDEMTYQYSPRVNESDNYKDYELNIVNQLGDLTKHKNKVVSSTYFNVANHRSVNQIHRFADIVGLSTEINLNQIESVINSYKEEFNSKPNVMVHVYGRIDSMIMKYELGQKTTKLKDRKNTEFNVFRDEENFSHILSHKAIKLIKEVPLLQVFGVTNFFLRFTTETKEETKRILEEFKRTYS